MKSNVIGSFQTTYRLFQSFRRGNFDSSHFDFTYGVVLTKLQATDYTLKLQIFHAFKHGLIRHIQLVVSQIELYIGVGNYGCKFSAHVGVVAPFGQLCQQCALLLGQMVVYVVQCVVFLQQSQCRFFTHALYAGNVVRSIAAQCLVIYHLRGAHAELFRNVVNIDAVHVGNAALSKQNRRFVGD